MFFDLIEHLRRYTDDGVAFPDVLGLTLLNAPTAFYRILPLVVILTTIALFFSLARTSELVVTRAAGRSALRALLAPVAVAFAIGATMLFLCVNDPRTLLSINSIIHSTKFCRPPGVSAVMRRAAL